MILAKKVAESTNNLFSGPLFYYITEKLPQYNC